LFSNVGFIGSGEVTGALERGPKGVDVLAQQPVLGYPRPLGARQVEQGGKQSGANAATWRDYIELCLIDSGARLGSWTTIDAMTTDNETTVIATRAAHCPLGCRRYP
jgi:hypothetical protein